MRILPSSRPGQRAAAAEVGEERHLAEPGHRARAGPGARRGSRRARSRPRGSGPRTSRSPSASRAHGHARRRRRPPAPRSTGWSRRTPGWRDRVVEQDLVELRALHLVGVGRPRLAPRGSRTCPRARVSWSWKVAPYFFRNPWPAIVRARPGARAPAGSAGSSDSPTWKRGNASRSATATGRPPRARKVAAVDPPGRRRPRGRRGPRGEAPRSWRPGSARRRPRAGSRGASPRVLAVDAADEPPGSADRRPACTTRPSSTGSSAVAEARRGAAARAAGRATSAARCRRCATARRRPPPVMKAPALRGTARGNSYSSPVTDAHALAAERSTKRDATIAASAPSGGARGRPGRGHRSPVASRAEPAPGARGSGARDGHRRRSRSRPRRRV